MNAKQFVASATVLAFEPSDENPPFCTNSRISNVCDFAHIYGSMQITYGDPQCRLPYLETSFPSPSRIEVHVKRM